MKNLKRMIIIYMVMGLTAFTAISGMYALAGQLDKAALAKSVESFPDHSEITIQTLNH